MGPRVISVFIHDSIAVGEDGPTHEPVEQLTGLRKAENAGSVDHGSDIGVNRYGASAPGELVLEKYGFTVDNVIAKAEALLGR